jgi:hypothetical protein
MMISGVFDEDRREMKDVARGNFEERRSNMQPYTPSSNFSPPPPLPRLARPMRLGVSPLVVVLICLLLGLALGWGYSGELAASRMAQALDVTKTNLTFVQSHQSELATLLADPQSRVVPFNAVASTSGATVALVWNPQSGHGVLLCQALWPLPDGEKYQLKANEGGNATALVSFTPTHGVTVIAFDMPAGGSFSHFELSAGQKNSAASQTLFTAVRS